MEKYWNGTSTIQSCQYCLSFDLPCTNERTTQNHSSACLGTIVPLESDEHAIRRPDPEQQIREYLESQFGEHGLGRTDDIFQLGYVNSLFALELVTFIERTFDLVLEVDDLELAHFRSIASMTELVTSRRDRRPADLDTR